jgi:transcriptional regulator with XRE-family HTH domain
MSNDVRHMTYYQEMQLASPAPRAEPGPAASSRIGGSLRSARLRAGWTREALARHSGLSFAGIAQIESGRRQEVRVSSLLALASALGVSVDYLLGISATKLLGHSVLIYSSDAEYVASACPFLRDGLARSECALAVTATRQIGLLREALGDDAMYVEFADSSEWYGSSATALSRYRIFMKDRFERGAPWIRIIGEPVWAARSEAEVGEWARYESAINLSFASSPATIVCPYDARSVSDSVLAIGLRTHPEVAEAGNITPSGSYEDPEDFLLRGAQAGW